MEEIFCFVDERLPEFLVRITERTIHDAGIIFDTTAKFAGSAPMTGLNGSDFTRAGTIVRESEYGTQRDAGQINGTINRRLYGRNRRIVFITTDDLTCRSDGNYLNFCFGYAIGGTTTISMTRFRSLPENEQEIILAGLIMHELGHLFYLAGNPKRAKTEYVIGMHCKNRHCVMRQGLSVEEIRRNFLSVEKHTRHTNDIRFRYYCPLCVKDVNDYIRRREERTPKRETVAKNLPPLPPRRKGR